MGTCSTRAPAATASSAVRSVELSTIRISPDDAGLGQPLLAPGDEVGDRQLLVERRDDDREVDLVGLDLVRGRQQLDVGGHGQSRTITVEPSKSNENRVSGSPSAAIAARSAGGSEA